MALDPIVSGTLNQMLEGNSFVEHKPGYGGPIHEWGYGHDQEHRAKQESGWYAASREHPEVGLMNPQEFEEWKKANGLPPTVRSTGALGGPVTPPETPWSMGVPFAKGKSTFSNPYWDKQDDIRKYLDNDRRLIDSLIRRGKIKV